jgi:hypothetical protein
MKGIFWNTSDTIMTSISESKSASPFIREPKIIIAWGAYCLIISGKTVCLNCLTNLSRLIF